MYREWKKIGFPKGYYIWIWEQEDWDVDQEIDGKMKCGRMEELLVERGGRKKYITDRNGRWSWERQGIVASWTCQWNERLTEWMNECTNFKQGYTNFSQKLRSPPPPPFFLTEGRQIKVHTTIPQTLSATVQHSTSWVNWYPEFAHPILDVSLHMSHNSNRNTFPHLNERPKSPTANVL